MASVLYPSKKEYLELIGLIVVESANLENSLNRAISQILDITSEEAEIITAELSFNVSLHIFCSLFLNKFSADKEALAQLEDARQKADKAMVERNTIAHSIWGIGKETGEVFRLKTTAKMAKGLRHNDEVITTEKLLDSAQKVRNAVWAFGDLERKYLSAGK